MARDNSAILNWIWPIFTRFFDEFSVQIRGFLGSEYCYNHILTPFNTPSGHKHHKMIKIDLRWTLGGPVSNLNVEAESRHDWSFNRSCPSVRGGLEYIQEYSKNISKYSRIFQNIKEFQNIQDYSKMLQIIKEFQNIQYYSKIFRNIPKYSRIFQEYSKTFQENSKIYQNIPKYSRKVEMAATIQQQSK